MSVINPYYVDKWVEISSFRQMVSQKMLGFIGIVMENESLDGWKVEIWGCKGEGECDSDLKVICLGVCLTDIKTKSLFLHEAAHALVNENLGDWHNERWLNEYKRLCEMYMVGEPFAELRV